MMKKNKEISLNQFKYFIFDKDGTLVKTLEIYSRVFMVLIEKKYRIPTIYAKKFFLKTSGLPLKLQFKEITKHFGIETTEDDFLEFQREFSRLSNLIEPELYPYAEEIIKFLHSKKKELFLSTGGKEIRAIRILKSHNLLKYFKKVLGSDNIHKSEKHIYAFAEEVKEEIINFSKKACFIGDGLYDIKIAKSLNIFMISLTTTFNRETLEKENPDLIIDSLSEILKYF